MFADDFGVDLFYAGEGMVDVVGFDDLEALLAHGFLQFGVFEDFGDAVGYGSDVAGVAKKTALIVFDQLGNSAGANSDGGEAASHGFHQDDALRFGGGGNSEKTSGAVNLCDVVTDDAAGKGNGIGDI